MEQAKKNDNKGNIFISILKNGRIQLFLTLAGVLVALLNVWIASRIAPLGQDIAVVQTHVSALENTLEDRPELLERFVIVETEVKGLSKKVDSIESKIDRLIDRE